MLYPVGIQSFKEIREGGYLYVDKTALMYNLVSTGKYYFLSRPRRFGKSLLTSTLEAYFKGEKELFRGLAIESFEKDWTEYPVLHIDFSGVAYKAESDLQKMLNQVLTEWEDKYGITAQSDLPGLRFRQIIDAAYEVTGHKVVVLIDEYGKPIEDNLTNEELRETYRAVLQGFYSTLKVKDEKIKFAFLTGVSKIGKVSVFSGMNNLRDISMVLQYAELCGISEAELQKYFDESIAIMAAEHKISKETCYRKLKEQYDGYRFHPDSEGVYNPFSLLNSLQDREYGNYWFETGTPSLLVDVLRKTTFDITTLDNQEVIASSLNGADSIVDNPVPLLFQTGYLTIKSYDPDSRLYTLGYPNGEVKEGFLNSLITYYLRSSNPEESKAKVPKMRTALIKGRPEDFMNYLTAFFANISYQIQGNAEKNFQYAMYIILDLIGMDVQVERATSSGRIDLTVQTKEYIYIIELKINSSVEKALQQIEEKGYARPFATNPRKLYKIGINFSTATRCIEDWKIVG